MDGHVVAAGVLDAPQVQDLGAAGRHLQHLLGGDAVELAGRRDDPRVGGEDAVDVAVDLADVGAQRRGQRDRGGVGGAAAERGDVLGVLRDALEAGDDRDRAARRWPFSIRPGVMSMILALPCAESVITPACEPVNDCALWPSWAIAIASSAIEIRSPAVSSMSSSRGGGSGVTCSARSRSSSVVSPIAETTTTTSWPALLGVDDALGDPLDAGRRRRPTSRRTSARQCPRLRSSRVGGGLGRPPRPVASGPRRAALRPARRVYRGAGSRRRSEHLVPSISSAAATCSSLAGRTRRRAGRGRRPRAAR